jgi:hypothetical protein
MDQEANARTTADAAPETPLERAARREVLDPQERAAILQRREAAAVLGGIGDYVARTNPAGLPEADAQLSAWKIPEGEDTAVSPGESLASGSVVSVFSAGSESEANIVRGVLQAAGIPVSFDSLPAPTMGNVFSVSEPAWGDVVVPVEYAEAARAAIEEAVSAGDPDISTADALYEEEKTESSPNTPV